jgi:shikimate kinase
MGEKTIVLLGPKHSGKTSAGMALAASLHCLCIDLDELIETKTGKKPRALYTEGVEVFKKAETEALGFALGEALAGEKNTVVAAGGGIIDNEDAVEYLSRLKKLKNMEKAVILIFLEVSANTAWNRIRVKAEASGELPPFLRTEKPEETHRLLHERRNFVYKRLAHLTIMAENKTAEEIAAGILQIWGRI